MTRRTKYLLGILITNPATQLLLFMPERHTSSSRRSASKTQVANERILCLSTSLRVSLYKGPTPCIDFTLNTPTPVVDKRAMKPFAYLVAEGSPDAEGNSLALAILLPRAPLMSMVILQC
ncbi:uncharacterized protein EDB91DRAFT_1161492 [Suillus paluster]|uniref:uncharacterized protein n=1 Tax=Suillus paluster TaxID=48578 RepID=UPI001B87EE20|nr:uncharacterized protein EDB91DRAFT_1161492 [Suillus paluster]KAG1728483.1 hypothetical protein EDB91DRAFT_1161492 [Suillus paluster]